MSFEWQDKKDGVDDILADDINRIAHAIGSGLTTIGKIAPKVEQHEKDIENLNKPAGYRSQTVSLVGITTGGSGAGVNKITDTNIYESIVGTYNIGFQGKAELEVNVSCYENSEFYIDDVLIDSGASFTVEWAGTVEQGIKIVLADGEAWFEKFNKLTYTNGFMTGEQAEKLENTPTRTEVENLINEAFGTVEAVFDEVHEYAESLGGKKHEHDT